MSDQTPRPPAPPASRAPFATGYEQRSGEMMVYGGLLVGLFALSVAVPRGSFPILILSLVAFAVAYYHWPMVQKGRAQIAATDKGLMLAGLGVVAWDAIRDIRIMDRAVRTIRNAELQIALSRPLPHALSDADAPGLAQQMMYRVWRVRSPELVVVKLEPLRASPEAIEAAIRPYLAVPPPAC